MCIYSVVLMMKSPHLIFFPASQTLQNRPLLTSRIAENRGLLPFLREGEEDPLGEFVRKYGKNQKVPSRGALGAVVGPLGGDGHGSSCS